MPEATLNFYGTSTLNCLLTNCYSCCTVNLITKDLPGFPGGSDGKESNHNAGDQGSTPQSGRSPGEGNGNPLQDSYLENSLGRGASQATVYGVTKSQTQLSDQHFLQTNSTDYQCSSKMTVTTTTNTLASVRDSLNPSNRVETELIISFPRAPC